VISLIGMPGSGKSTVGRQMARRLGLAFLDADAVLEAQLGCPIAQFFADHGEAAFRDREELTLRDLATRHVGVLATGGGAVLRESNRIALRQAGPVVYLRATPEDLIVRLRNDRVRPLLQVADPMARLRELFAQRDPLYSATAHLCIAQSRASVSVMVREVIAALESLGALHGLPTAVPGGGGSAGDTPTPGIPPSA
jgi:shikimate kinase